MPLTPFQKEVLGVLAGKFADAAGNLNKDTYQLSASTDVLEDNNKVLISFNTLASPTPAPGHPGRVGKARSALPVPALPRSARGTGARG